LIFRHLQEYLEGLAGAQHGVGGHTCEEHLRGGRGGGLTEEEGRRREGGKEV
jgi:hypothetical protein